MRVLLVPNTANPVAVGAATELATWLTAQGVQPILEMSDAAACGLVDFGVEHFEIGEPVLVVSLGGDGTILKAVHMVGEFEVPVLGINMGRLGFLTATGPGQARTAIASALAGDVRVERRATVRVRAFREGSSEQWRALNEVFIGRSDQTRVVGIGLAIQGVPITSMRADGIIVATATGSTAYALSAGGPVVAPGFGGMVVVPTAPHTLATRAIVTDLADMVEITIDSDRAAACIAVDGENVPCPAPLVRVEVSRDPTDVLLVRIDDRGFYDTLAAEFFGG